MNVPLPPPVKNGVFKPPAGGEYAYVRLGDGRHLLVWPLSEGAGVQMMTVGKRGGIVEAAPVALDSVPRLIHLVDEASEIAWRMRRVYDRRRDRERERRLAEAYARNPFSPEYKGKYPNRFRTAPRASLEETYVGGPR